MKIDRKNCLDSLICFALYLLEVEKNQLLLKGRINLYIDYIKI